MDRPAVQAQALAFFLGGSCKQLNRTDNGLAVLDGKMLKAVARPSRCLGHNSAPQSETGIGGFEAADASVAREQHTLDESSHH